MSNIVIHSTFCIFEKNKNAVQQLIGSDSSVVRASTLEAVSHRFDPLLCYTKGDENGTGTSLIDRNKG